eukprot:scaffold15867_cov222-Skeletonema_marinoi.AAC.2
MVPYQEHGRANHQETKDIEFDGVDVDINTFIGQYIPSPSSSSFLAFCFKSDNNMHIILAYGDRITFTRPTCKLTVHSQVKLTVVR